LIVEINSLSSALLSLLTKTLITDLDMMNRHRLYYLKEILAEIESLCSIKGNRVIYYTKN
jgi:hypothetical protein